MYCEKQLQTLFWLMSSPFSSQGYKGAVAFATACGGTCKGLILHHSTPNPDQKLLCFFPFILPLDFVLCQELPVKHVNVAIN
jgi:hypothetical protein